MLLLHLLCKSTDSQSLVRPSHPFTLHWDLVLLLRAHLGLCNGKWDRYHFALEGVVSSWWMRRVLVLLVAAGKQMPRSI